MKFTDKYTNTAALITPVICSFLYISLIFNDNLWMDEAFSAVLIKGSFSSVLENSAKDTLPPLYNILGWCAARLFGFSAPTLRLVSILPMIGILILSATLVRRYFGNMASILFSICITGMPQMLYYGTEIRMYALGLFFVTACGILAVTDNSAGGFTAFILCALGAGYTHHFAFVAVGFIFLFLLVKALISGNKKNLLKIVIQIAVTAILYIPCLITTLHQMKRVTGYFTMPDINAAFIISCIKQPFITGITPLSAILILIYPCVCALKLLSELCIPAADKKDHDVIFPVISGPLLFLCVLLFGAAACIILKTNIFSERYLFPTYGMLWLSFSIAASGLKNNALKKPTSTGKDLISGHRSMIAGILPLIPRLFPVIITPILTAVLVTDYITEFKASYDPSVEEMKTYFEQNISPDDTYIIHEKNYEIEICFRYYFPEFKKTDWDKADPADGSQLWYIRPVNESENSSPISGETKDSGTYQISDTGQISDTDQHSNSVIVPDADPDPTAEISGHGYTCEYAGDFSFDRYHFRLYKITGQL